MFQTERELLPDLEPTFSGASRLCSTPVSLFKCISKAPLLAAHVFAYNHLYYVQATAPQEQGSILGCVYCDMFDDLSLVGFTALGSVHDNRGP